MPKSKNNRPFFVPFRSPKESSFLKGIDSSNRNFAIIISPAERKHPHDFALPSNNCDFLTIQELPHSQIHLQYALPSSKLFL